MNILDQKLAFKLKKNYVQCSLPFRSKIKQREQVRKFKFKAVDHYYNLCTCYFIDLNWLQLLSGCKVLSNFVYKHLIFNNILEIEKNWILWNYPFKTYLRTWTRMLHMGFNRMKSSIILTKFHLSPRDVNKCLEVIEFPITFYAQKLRAV